MKRYTDAFKRMYEALTPIATYYGKPKSYFLWDALCGFIRYGITPNQYIGFEFYRKSSLERKNYFTARDQDKYDSKFNDPICGDTFNRKEITNRVFSKWVRRDWIYTDRMTSADVEQFVNKHHKVIVKPTGLSSGRGIYTIEREKIRKDNASLWNSLNISKLGGVLIEEFVSQHVDMSSCNPDSVNTVRIFTVLSKDGKMKILSAGIRVGGKGSDVDNYHSGGVGYPIDPVSGVVIGAGHGIDGTAHFMHPSTGKLMIGFQVPNWEEVSKAVKEMVTVEPRGRLIGWDLAITEEGVELIEANYLPDPGFMQRLSERGLKREILEFL